MYDSSVLHDQMVTMVIDFNRNLWKKSSSMTPYESMYNLLSKDGTVKS